MGGRKEILFCDKIKIWKEFLKTGTKSSELVEGYNMSPQTGYKTIQEFFKFRRSNPSFIKYTKWESLQINDNPYGDLSEIERKIKPDQKFLDSNYYLNIRGII